MSVFDWFLVTWGLLNISLAVAIVLKPRTPIESGVAVGVVAINLVFVVGLLIARGVL